MENSLIIGLIGSLIGGGFAFTGVIINSYFTRKNLILQLEHQKQQDSYKLEYQKQQEEIKLKLSKLDELYQAILEFQKAGFIYYSTVLRIYKEPVADEVINEQTINLLTPMQRVNVLICLYSPDLYSLFEKLSAAVVEFQHQGSAMMDKHNTDHKTLDMLHWNTTNATVELLEKIQDASTIYTGLPKINLLPEEKRQDENLLS